MRAYGWSLTAAAISLLTCACGGGVSQLDRQAIADTVSCREIASDADRLACLDNASEALARTLIVRESADGAREPYEARGDDAGKTAALASASSIADPEADPVADPIAGPDASPEAPAAGQLDDEAAFGAERLVARAKAKDENRRRAISAQIAEIVVDPFEKLTVTLDNGQVWRQLASDERIVRFSRDTDVYTAEISRGVFGNYFLKIVENGRVIRVRRIR